MNSNEKTSFEVEDPNEPQPEPPVKHKALYALFVTSAIVAPWAAGGIILFNEKKLKDWNWL